MRWANRGGRNLIASLKGSETLTVLRGATDAMSNRVVTAIGSVEAIFAWGSGARGTGRFGSVAKRDESASITANVYVPRGSDVQARDRLIRNNGEEYAVVGHPLWDQLSPFTGHDFGYMVLQVQATNG